MQQTPIKVPDSHVDLLERPLFAHFATIAVDGSPRGNPMWFLWDAEAGVLTLTHTHQRFNFRSLRENPRAALSITATTDLYPYLQVRGQSATAAPDPTAAF